MEETLENGRVPREKLCLIYLGFDLEELGGPVAEKSNDVVVTVGEITWSNLKRKGLEVFVRCAAMVPGARFYLAGQWLDDSIDYLKKIAPPNMNFTGFLSDEALNDLLDSAKVYVQVSYHEAFGCSLAEAMLKGCIPVVTNRFALPEVVGSTGIYVPYGDVGETAQAVRNALNLGPQWGMRARQRILTNFMMRRREEALRKVIQEVFDGSPQEREAA